MTGSQQALPRRIWPSWLNLVVNRDLNGQVLVIQDRLFVKGRVSASA